MPPKRKKRKGGEEDDDDGIAKTKKTKIPLNKTLSDWASMDLTNSSTTKVGKKKWNFKISTWNVDGLRAWLKKGSIDFLKHEDPDVICLQETKCSEDKLPEEITELKGYPHQYWLAAKKDGYSGVAMLSKKKPLNVQYGLDSKEHDDQGRVITAEFPEFFLVTVYVLNAGRKLVTLDKRMDFDPLLREHLKKLDKTKPVIACGDFNVAHEEIDLANPKSNKRNAGFTPEERESFGKLLGSGFVDTFRHFYPDKTGAYTFWTYMMNCRGKNVGWRLDYFLVSKRWVDKHVTDAVIRSEVFGSDHCPLTLFIHK